MNFVYREKEDWSTYRILIFLDEDKYDKQHISRYIDYMYQSYPGIEFMTIDDPDMETFDPNKYYKYYIVPQQRELRQNIRHKVKERTGVDIHIEMYYKLVNCVNRRMYIK